MATAPAMATERLLSEGLRGSCCSDTGGTSFLAAAGVTLLFVAAGCQRYSPRRLLCCLPAGRAAAARHLCAKPGLGDAAVGREGTATLPALAPAGVAPLCFAGIGSGSEGR